MASVNAPLAERMRPATLDDIIGQVHLLGEGAVLRKAISSGRIPSMILWGPPGVGKTTLARVISTELDRPFIPLSAINSGVKDIREAIDKARKQQFFSRPNPILFIDEIHRFSKSQQDSLLGAVEEGLVTLIGATTENPSFEVISALLSRCQVYVLEHLGVAELTQIIDRVFSLGTELTNREVDKKELTTLLQYSGGDARKLINILELLVSQVDDDQPIVITDALVREVIQKNITVYDKGGDQHYDTISAFIKSVRGSDPNAAVYWLARMIEGGEDPKFIARRLVILAAEDIGLANPNALLIANACTDAVNFVGMPEGRIILSQATIYLASCSKSNSAYTAIGEAQSAVRKTGALAIPLALRSAPTKLMKELGYGENYGYSHDGEGNFVYQNFLPDELEHASFYNPGNNASEQRLKERLKGLWKDKYDF